MTHEKYPACTATFKDTGTLWNTAEFHFQFDTDVAYCYVTLNCDPPPDLSGESGGAVSL